MEEKEYYYYDIHIELNSILQILFEQENVKRSNNNENSEKAASSSSSVLTLKYIIASPAINLYGKNATTTNDNEKILLSH